MESGVAAVVIAEEALTPAAARRFTDFLNSQEPWSDLPIIVFTDPGVARRTFLATLKTLEPLGNVTLLNRPVDLVTVVSAARGALRARRRQYAARSVLLERARAEEALRDSDRHKTEFLAILSHELRNPLAPIRNSLYLLDRVSVDTEQARRAKQVIHRQTEHLARLVDDLLDITRISRGKIELRRARIDVREVAQRACDDHQTLFEERGITLRLEVAGPLWIDADEARIAQVLGNLLQNGAKFVRKNGTVTVVVAARDGEAEIRVRDDGVGMQPDALPRVFEPFVQADNRPAEAKGGLGLGLALVKGLVELHGGTVSASSGGPNRGSEFLVKLPLAPSGSPAPAKALGPVASRSMEVLVIDDNDDAAQSLAEVLTWEGHHVHVSTDGHSGVEKARELAPDLVLCDLGLPDMTGYDVARALRSNGIGPSQRLIALSGYAQDEDRRRAKAAGFDAHLAKPLSMEALFALLAEKAEE
jgi:signal transduction histidine kinase/CheY-like chemotaxis protein